MESWNEGEKSGEKKATVRLNKLNSILIREKRFDDLKRATENPMYQTKLISELLSNEEDDWEEEAGAAIQNI